MPKENKNPLDTFREKRGRGRPWKASASEVFGRASNFRMIFSEIWAEAGERLLKAQTDEEVLRAFDGTAYRGQFEYIPSLVLKVLHEPLFPRKRAKAQINFVADSLAAMGDVSPRRSRDICAKERARERAKSPHKILRKEYYIECSCGYKGPARDKACRKCGAEISLVEELFSGGVVV